MMSTRRRGAFTLIELLVVIAIIGILAAMLFPVFARARESARKIQCLSNVKNIAMAIQMYLTDYDRFPPYESREEVLAYFDGSPGRGGDWSGDIDGHCVNGRKQCNPYVRWPVVLDEYIKNRDVWSCPSARIMSGAAFIVPIADYFSYWVRNEGSWGDGSDTPVCAYAYPVGWGGTVTDSLAQGQLAEGVEGAFVQSIATNSNFMNVALSSIERPAQFVICGDGGVKADAMAVGITAYPEVCLLECGNEMCSWVDWANCASWAADCGLYDQAPMDGYLLTNLEARKHYSRHLGGVNLGYLDGHARWISSQALVSAVGEGEVDGIYFWGPTSTCGFYDWAPRDVPTIY